MENQNRNWIKKYLMPDEYVVWNGRPGSGNLLDIYDILAILFSIIWGILCIASFAGSSPFWPKLFPILLICVGCYLMAFRRVIRKSHLRKEIIYVITNKRIFCFTKKQIKTLDYHTQLTRTVTLHKDGYGTIRFYSSAPSEMLGYYSREQLKKQIYFVLENIPDVDRVLQILS